MNDNDIGKLVYVGVVLWTIALIAACICVGLRWGAWLGFGIFAAVSMITGVIVWAVAVHARKEREK